jgi:selenocysteine lyase/cysteine desulfurase
VRHPLELVDAAHDQGWDVLLDAAAFVPTNRLDLSQIQPDFVTISFYKMFGYPSGVGCLLIRTGSIAKMRRPWFAGGTVNFATVQGRRHVLAPREAGFEDGTCNYLSIPAVEIGLRHLERITIDTIHTRVRCLTGWLLDQLLALRCRTAATWSGLRTCNDGDARRVRDDELLVPRPSARLPPHRAGKPPRISPTGCFCNRERAKQRRTDKEDMLAGAAGGADMTLPRFMQVIQHRGGKSAGAIRVSLGIVSNFADVNRFVQFASELRDQTRLTIGEVTFDIESCRVIRDGA